MTEETTETDTTETETPAERGSASPLVGSPFVYSGPKLAEDGLALEWLETDGLGGFACGTVSGARTRKYHGWYAPALGGARRRWLMVAGCEEFVSTAVGPRAGISTQIYRGAVYPEGRRSLVRFALDPFPIWRHEGPGFAIERSLCLPRSRAVSIVRWVNCGRQPFTLEVRPLLAFRDVHALQREGAFRATTDAASDVVRIAASPDAPPLWMRAPGARQAFEPDWYRRFHYPVEEERGYDSDEDLWSPLLWRWELEPGAEAFVVFARAPIGENPAALLETERRRRRAFPESGDPLFDGAFARAETFLAEPPGEKPAILAGFPWFTEWGRDAMISAPGLALATGRYRPFAAVINAFAAVRRNGLLPNFFPEEGGDPGYDSVDAPLWFVIAVEWFARARRDPGGPPPLLTAVRDVLASYRDGVAPGVRVGDDHLVTAGAPGRALTWMDAVVDGEPVTPRRGRAVEINALWHAALKAAARLERLGEDHTRARELEGEAWRVSRRFNDLFWSEPLGHLHDVIADDGTPDPSLRPNQIFAVSLSEDLLPPHRARAVYWSVRRSLLAPFGLRTLEPANAAYRGRCEGTQRERDAAYHQGTVWPWLLGAFVDAHFRVLGRSAESLRAVRGWLAPLRAHVREAGIGSISEIFDGDPPHTPRGAFAQAWSVAEVARIVRTHLAE